MKFSFIIYDNDTSTNDFPLGVGYLLSVMRQRGVPDRDIAIYNMDVFHYNDDDLYRYLKENEFDAIGIGMIAGYWPYRQLKRMMAIIETLPKRPRVILGGAMFSPTPEYYMTKFQVDYVVIGEAEISFPMLYEAIANKSTVEDIPGIAYWKDGKPVLNCREKPVQELDSIPFPAWDRFPIENYVLKTRLPRKDGRAQRTMPVLSTRGCHYTCSFCYRMETGYRARSLDSVMEEVKRLIKDYNVNSICFRDELLMNSPERTLKFAERIIQEGIKINFDIDGRLKACRKDVLETLARAGCVYINYGVESFNNQVLKNMNKRQTTDEIVRGIEATLEAGINPGLNVIFGNIGDNRQTLKETVDFLLKYNTYCEMRTMKPVTPYPGAPLFDTAVSKGLLKDVEDFWEHKHVNSDLLTCNFTELSDNDFYQAMNEANEIIIKDHFNHITNKYIKTHQNLYFEKNTNFRGVRS